MQPPTPLPPSRSRLPLLIVLGAAVLVAVLAVVGIGGGLAFWALTREEPAAVA